MEQNKRVDKPLLTHFKTELDKLTTLKRDHDKLHLLFAIAEDEKFRQLLSTKIMFGNTFQDLNHFTMFMKKYLKKTVVFIIDGIDENRYLFKERFANKESVKLFYHSSVSQRILSAVMAHNFHLSLFYPAIDDIDLRDAVGRNNKFPTYEMNWNTKSLMDYADFILQGVNEKASGSRCKSFTDFQTLVDYSNEVIASIIDEIRTPRELHYFMVELIREMNECANDVKKPFIATVQNVKDAYRKSVKHVHKGNRIRE
ncbi:unnamed protein product [Rotaria socialis]|uniref:Uncharacterized protein n=1 Tax=Rotaria socialis TaxID=392032 RepID=A0A818BYZ8_9BILA|nr:unnamed protein product [Rotaria socialis]CAF4527468.1 unnamed protein product [Rotaria socialis]